MKIRDKRIIDAYCKDDCGDWIYTLNDLSKLLFNKNKAARKCFFDVKTNSITYKFIYIKTKDFNDWENIFYGKDGWVETYIGSETNLEKIMKRDENAYYIIFIEARHTPTYGRRLTFKGVYLFDRTENNVNYYQFVDSKFNLNDIFEQ